MARDTRSHMTDVNDVSVTPETQLLAKIGRLSKSLGIQQKELAQLTNVTSSQMNLYLNGKIEMKTDRLVKLLMAVGIDLDQLIEQKLESIDPRSKTIRANELNIIAKLERVNEHNKVSILKIASLLGKG